MQKYTGQSLEGRHKYVVEPGFTIWAPEKSCLFCRKCDDIIWDYTNGPYCFFCEKDADGKKELTERGAIGKCEYFDENYEYVDEQNVDRERQEDEIREVQEKLKNDPEYKKLYDEFAKHMMDYILYGNAFEIPPEILKGAERPL